MAEVKQPTSGARDEPQLFGVSRRLVLGYIIPVLLLAFSIQDAFSAPDDAGPWRVLTISFVVGAILAGIAVWLAATKRLPSWGGPAVSSVVGISYHVHHYTEQRGPADRDLFSHERHVFRRSHGPDSRDKSSGQKI